MQPSITSPFRHFQTTSSYARDQGLNFHIHIALAYSFLMIAVVGSDAFKPEDDIISCGTITCQLSHKFW